jgi:hypothetical protein
MLLSVLIKADTIRNVNQALEHFVQKEELFGFTHHETKQEVTVLSNKYFHFSDLTTKKNPTYH